MPSICPKCGEFAGDDVCAKCGDKVVAATTSVNMWKKAANGGSNNGGAPQSLGAIPTAFVGAARLKQELGTSQPPLPPPPRKEKATALYNFIPQDPQVQLRLVKGEEVEVIRKDADGWWFITKDDEKGLVPGSYLKLHNPVVVHVPDAAILAAREASNQRLMQMSSRSSLGSSRGSDDSGVDYNSSLRLEGLSMDDASNPQAPKGPASVDAKASDMDRKPTVRKLRKCYACRETILGRTKTAKSEIFHEICLLCPGCRESIEEDEDFTLIKKKAFHAECAKDVKHCRVCDKEILGRVYKAGEGSFHRLCMVCSLCNQQAEEGSKFEDEKLACKTCVEAQARTDTTGISCICLFTSPEKKEREEREAREAAERAAAKAKAEKEAAEAAARALLAKKEREAAEAAARAKKEQEEREERARAEQAAKEAEEARKAKEAKEAEEAAARAAAAAAAAATRNARGASTASLDQFDLGPFASDGLERMSEVSDFDSEFGSDYSFMNNSRDSMRLSQVLDLESIDAFNNGARSSRGFERLSTLSDVSSLSDRASDARGADRHTHASVREEDGDYLSDEDGEQELCGGCNRVLEGEAVGALNCYFHYECFKCSHCRNVIAEDDGYAEKDNKAYHQNCYQEKFGKRCCRCTQTLKGKVVKALDNLYHPGCFVCFNCNSSLSESFFEHDGQAVCAKCKHSAITIEDPIVAENLTPISTATVGYQFSAQDDTQLTMFPGDEVLILQKDDDGWWLVDIKNKRGYVPGSYLVEHPPKKESKPATPGLCSECATQNPAEARFCRSCGNQLIE